MKDISNRQDIEEIVKTFYSQAINNDDIGYFFSDVVQLNWDIHIPKIVDFWESILLGNPVFKGNPMGVHIEINKKSALSREHFTVWLSIWKKTVTSLFEGPKADEAIIRAINISEMMIYKIGQSS